MKVTIEKSYNGERRPATSGALLDKVKPFCYLGMTGVYRCACDGNGNPLGHLYTGPAQTNPEWIVTVERGQA